MNCIRNSILRHASLIATVDRCIITGNLNGLKRLSQMMSSSTTHSRSPDQIMDQVVGIVKKFDKADASKVSEKADFQKDLSLDSLDQVELVMAFEQEFSIEIPEEEADKLTCCADVARYIASAGKATSEQDQ